jgi:hypothetical protein
MPEETKAQFWRTYKTFVKKSDIYCVFLEKGTSLIKKSGMLGFIVSDGWLRLDSFQELRNFLLNNTAVTKIVDFEGNVFEQCNVKTCLVFLSKARNSSQKVEVATTQVTTQLDALPLRLIPQSLFGEQYKQIFDLSLDRMHEIVKAKMRSVGTPIGEVFEISFGLKTGDDSKFLSYTRKSGKYKPLLRGEDVHKYSHAFKGEYVWYAPQLMTAHRRTARPGNSERFEQPKVLVRDTGGGLHATFENEDYYAKDVLIVESVQKDTGILKYLAGILNSRLMRFYYETSFPTLHVQRDELASLPFRTIDTRQKADKAAHDRMVSLVESMLELHKRLSAAKSEAEKAVIQRQIDHTDAEIDRLVYALYGLKKDEIAIVEQS